MFPIRIKRTRLLLRDFREEDRTAFVRYQTDPKYIRLYDFSEKDTFRAEQLFDQFIAWQREEPRVNVQLGVFDATREHLLGSAGLRNLNGETAALGIELVPAQWGRFRIALDVASALLEYGFGKLKLRSIIGQTASGNTRVEKLARWFGAEVVDRRPGPRWMKSRDWDEVDWALSRDAWMKRKHG